MTTPYTATPYYSDDQVTLWHGDSLDVLRTMPAESVNCVVTSPPYYGLRDYGEPGQYGLEATPAEYVERMRQVFAEVRRVLAVDGTLWLNLGDSYSTSPTGSRGTTSALTNSKVIEAQQGIGLRADRPSKNLLGIPWRVAFALQDDGWVLRNHIVWHKPNAMPESVTDRLSSRHESLFLLTRSPRYWFDLDPIREPLAFPEALDGSRVFGGKNKGGGEGRIGASARRAGLHPSIYGATGMPEQTIHDPAGSRHTHERGRNPGDVWSIPTQHFSAAHFAVFPPALAERCVLAGCRPGGTVLDPFAGSGTAGMVALKHGRRFVGIDLSATYLALALKTRLAQSALIEDTT